jgi:adenosylcobyric acid synthase
LSQSEQDRIVGFIINRFRGDVSLLQSGLDWLETKTGKPVLGVVNYLQGLHIEAEDAIDRSTDRVDKRAQAIKVVVPVLPRISNHTDFDVLRLSADVDFDFVGPGHPLPAADLIILPGSKSVRSDLQFLKDQGWYSAIQKHCRFGGKLLGICAGLQMLGQAIHDPLGIESAAGSSEGFGFLDIETTLAAEKQLRRVSGQLMLEDAVVSGYEIHAGTSTGPALNSPFASLDNRPDGVIAADGQIIGTYLHGLFDESASRAAVLRWAGSGHVEPMDYQQLRENAIDQLADELERALDLERIKSYLAD